VLGGEFGLPEPASGPRTLALVVMSRSKIGPTFAPSCAGGGGGVLLNVSDESLGRHLVQARMQGGNFRP